MHAQIQMVCNDITQTACMCVPAPMYVHMHTCMHTYNSIRIFAKLRTIMHYWICFYITVF